MFLELFDDEAYYIQLENIKKKLAAGQNIVGKKIGLTSVAVQNMLGVNEPDYGHLLDTMVVENGGTIDCSTMLQPKVEGEIAFILKKDLKGPRVTVLDVLQATDYVVPAWKLWIVVFKIGKSNYRTRLLIMRPPDYWY